MRTRAILAGLSLLATVACDAPTGGGQSGFITREGATVSLSPTGDSFSVQFRAGFRIQDYWCAAGRTAERFGSPTNRIWLLSDPGFPAGQSPRFTFTEPAGGGQPTGLNTIGGDPNSVSSATARTLCPTGRRRF